MHLKEFILQGFKSFADRTTIRLKGGIVAIVGPNGCGKSNIADGIRWVTGEKSAKSMRSPTMTDVIFSGSHTRKPLNFAEVTLVLSDIAGAMPTDYEDVAITRRLHRSGESEYLINKQPVRLKDIEDLLSGTGVGRSAISIFEQGKIDQVIYLNPEERRVLLEEVAGISRFIQRKKETLRNLQRTQDNLMRVSDILREVAKQKETAETQAKMAIIYKDLSGRLEILEKSLLVTKWRILTQDEVLVTEEFTKTNELFTEVSLSLVSVEEALFAARNQLDERQQVLSRKREALYQVKNKKELQEQHESSRKEKLQVAIERFNLLNLELETLQKAATEQLLQKEQLDVRQKAMDSQLGIYSTELHHVREKTKEQERLVGELREKYQQNQKERLQLVQKAGQSESEWKETLLRLDHFKERKEQSALRLQTLIEEVELLEKHLQNREVTLRDAASSIEEKRAKFLEMDRSLAEKKQEESALKVALEGYRNSLSEAHARLKVLLKLKEEMQGFSQGTKKLLAEAKRGDSPLFGKVQLLFELLTLEGETSLSIAHVLRPYGQTVVVKTKEDLSTLLSFVRTSQSKDLSVLCLEHLSKSDLSDHFLHHITQVSSIEEAVQKETTAWQEYATNDAAFIDRHRVIFYPSREENNVFLREKEIKSLEKEIFDETKNKEEKESFLLAIRKTSESLQSEKIEIERLIRKEEMVLAELQFTVKRTQSDLEKGIKQREDVSREQEAHTRTLHDLEEKRESIAVERAARLRQVEEQEGLHTSGETELAAAVEAMRLQQITLKENEGRFQQLLDESQQLTYSVSLLQARLQDAAKNSEKISHELTQITKMKESLQSEKGPEVGEMVELGHTLAKISESVSEETTLVEQCKANIAALETKTKATRIEEQQLLQKKTKLEEKIGHTKATFESLRLEMEERYALSFDQCETIDSLEDVKGAERELKKIRTELTTMGPVNMAAIDEQKEHEERFQYLTKQVEDLNVSKEELLAIISELDRESRKLFEETFVQVRENFKKNFQILFRGGEADLQLTGSDDVLEAGVDVIAKPPGKQMRSISLLSGGEKCMTALALLFAIFEVKPAPFCVLDEIDAPLDDSNIERFVTMLEQFTDKCQFVIITHNKRTMSIANTIYGVSMEERGVSKLLSIEFSKDPAAKTPDLQVV